MARVLVVDDDLDLLNLAAQQLRRAGHDVTAARSAQQALELIVEGKVPDVAVIDVAMPGMNGLAFLGVLRADEEFSGLSAIFLSARVSPSDIRAGRELGAIYLTKPYTIKGLLGAVDQCLEGACPKPSRSGQNGPTPRSAVTRVLVVDDDADLLKLVEIQLTRAGHEVATACSGEEALSIAVGNAVPDVAVLDVSMPGMSGLDLLGRLRARREMSELPAIFLSARVSPRDVRAGRELGAIYLTKPYKTNALLAAINQCLDGGCPRASDHLSA